VFDKAAYLALKRELMTRPRTLVSVAVFGEIVALMALALWLAGRSWPEYLVSQLLLAVAFFQSFGLLHECVHNIAAPKAWVNDLLGHLASLGCFLPFFPWRSIHQQHHLWTGHLDRDPTLGAIRAWRAAGSVPPLLRLAWRTWIPIAALVQHVVFWTYPLKLLRKRPDDSKQLLRSLFSVLFLIAGYAVILPLVARQVPLAHLFPALVIYLVTCELVNLPHHLGAPLTNQRLSPWEQWQSTRTCVYPRGVAEFFVLNFNLHIEHHIFPFLPWYKLRAARARLRNLLGGDYAEEMGVRWNFRHRRDDMNVVVFAANPAKNPAAESSAPTSVAAPVTSASLQA
jgi:acyl-lipid omega-6 desaturase (Delta-12 desaturase)